MSVGRELSAGSRRHTIRTHCYSDSGTPGSGPRTERGRRMTDVQARPAELNTFATNGRTIHTTLQTARSNNRPAFVAFRNAPGGGCAAEGDAIVNEAMTDLLSELDEIPKWVKSVHDALIAADVTD